MTKWINWKEDLKDEVSNLYGEGPFPVLRELDGKYHILVTIEVPKDTVVEVMKDERLYRDIRQTFGSNKLCNCQKKHSQQVAMICPIQPKKQESPYTSKFSIGDDVKTPQGLGKICDVRFKTVQVDIPMKGKITWDYWFIEPK